MATSFFLLTIFDIAPYRIVAPLSAISIVLLLAQAGSHSRLLSFLGVFRSNVFKPLAWVFAANAIFSRYGMRETIYSQLTSVLIALLLLSFFISG